jgi:hypothetical protein
MENNLYKKIYNITFAPRMFFCTEDPTKNQNVTTMPLVYRKDPGKIWGLAIPPLAMEGDTAGRNPARPVALPVGEGVRLV